VKAESTVMPVAPYEIEYEEDLAKITFFENVQPKVVEEGEAEKYEYDMYRLELINRDNLIANLDSNLDAWIMTAKDVEYAELADEVRKKRNKLLTESDWTQLVDASLTTKNKETWLVYRQALRNVPQQKGFPHDVVWPKLVI